MSYILDALKKAERERSIAQVPTLTTVHDSGETSSNPFFRPTVAVFLLLAAGLGFYLYLRNSGVRTAEKPAAYTESSYETGSRSAAMPDAGPQETFSPPNTYTAVPRSSLSNGSSSIQSGTGGEVSGSSPPPASSPAPAVSDSPELKTHDAVLPERFGAQPDIPDSENFSLTDPSGRASGESSRNTPSAEKNHPSTQTSSRAAALREAMKEMNISILLYAENPAERLVFINGRKYTEGDSIDGRFVIESIHSDGVLLHHEGERAILRPKTQ